MLYPNGNNIDPHHSEIITSFSSVKGTSQNSSHRVVRRATAGSLNPDQLYEVLLFQMYVKIKTYDMLSELILTS